MQDAIVYIDRSDIREGKLEDVKATMRETVEFIETHVPQLIAYGFYLDEEASRMTVVAIHRDPASMEFHMETGAPAFRKFEELIELRKIEIYGRPSDRVLNQLRQKAKTLGEDVVIDLHNQHAGFMRFPSSAT